MDGGRGRAGQVSEVLTGNRTLSHSLLHLASFAASNNYAQTADQARVKNVTYSNASYLLEQLLQGYDIRLRPGFGGSAPIGGKKYSSQARHSCSKWTSSSPASTACPR